jgi:hypothetical protein
MSSFIPLDTQDALDQFLVEVDDLHDALLREVAFLARGFVDLELRMFGDAQPCDVRVVFQMQSERTPCIDLVFEDVRELVLQPRLPLSPSGTVDGRGVTLSFAMLPSGEFAGVRAKGAKYRILDASSLGQDLLAVDVVPAGPVETPSELGDGWLSCGVCGNALQSTKSVRTMRCGSCGAVNEAPSVNASSG